MLAIVRSIGPQQAADDFTVEYFSQGITAFFHWL